MVKSLIRDMQQLLVQMYIPPHMISEKDILHQIWEQVVPGMLRKLILNVYSGPGAPAEATFRINAAGNALNPRNLIVKLNGDTVINQAMDFFEYTKSTAQVPLAKISGRNCQYCNHQRIYFTE